MREREIREREREREIYQETMSLAGLSRAQPGDDHHDPSGHVDDLDMERKGEIESERMEREREREREIY